MNGDLALRCAEAREAMNRFSRFFASHPKWKHISIGIAALAMRDLGCSDWCLSYWVHDVGEEIGRWHDEPIYIRDGLLQLCEAIPRKCYQRSYVVAIAVSRDGLME